MTNTPASFRRALAWLLAALSLAATAFAAEAKKSFNVAAGDAATALKQFAAQAGREIVFAPDAVKGAQTKAVSGELTPKDALDQLLADTGLVASQDAKTGALAVTKNGKNDLRAAQNETSDRPGQKLKVEDGVVKMGEFEVSGRRVDGLINKSLIPTGENVALYHDVISRAEIERLGVTSFEELFRYIPQTSTGANGFQSPPGNVQVSGGTVANVSRVGLRGFPQAQTLILINGRVQPRSGLFSSSGTDLSRIPIAAIDRVEILPVSGSAIYGGGALGGAINIILRKDFSSKEVTTYFGTSWDGGATEYRISYLDGRTFELLGRKATLTTLLDHRHRDPLYQGDRKYLQTAFAKYGPTSTIRNAAGVPIFETIMLNALAGAPATILVRNGPTAAVNDLGIPGSPGLRWAQVPRGTTAAASQALTPASFSANAGQFTPGDRFAQQTIYQPEDNYAANLQLEWALSEKLTLYSEIGYVYFRSKYSFPQSLTLNLSATDPLNPFRTNVTPGFVGRPIRIFIDPSDIADPSAFEERETARALLGVKGKIGEKWEWSLDGNFDYNHTFTASNNTVNLLPSLLSLTAFAGSTDPLTGQPYVPAPLDTRRAVYPILADHSQFPVPAGDTDKYWSSYRNSGSFTRNWIGIGRVTGPVYELPAGPLEAAVLGEYTKFDTKSGQSFKSSDDLWLLLSGFPNRDSRTVAPNARTTTAAAVEMRVPVFGEKWRPRFIPFTSLELNLSARKERAQSEFYSPPFGGNPEVSAENTKQGKAYVAAAKLQVLPDVALRYSYTDGLYVPDWNDFGDPRSTFLNSFLAAPDPKRGNTSQPLGTYDVLNGGNPNLLSETAVSENFGVIFSPRFLKGFSLNLDYWKIRKSDGINLIFFTDLIARSDDFPSRVIRAPLTPEDAALGYTAGLITLVDQTRINVSKQDTEGVDVQLSYDMNAGEWGNLFFSANTSFTNHFLTQNTPAAPFLESAGVTGPRRWRGRGSVTWSKDRWEVTLSSRYTGHFYGSTTAPTPLLPTAFPLDGGRIPAIMRYDAQFSYQIPAEAGRQDWKRWLSGSKWTVGCQNILNDQSSLISNGTGFYNTEDDPRQRFVYVSIKKSL